MKPEFDINTERTLLCAAIRDARKRSGLTQDQAAGALDITQSQLSMLENGRRRLSADMALKMSAVYGENIAETGLPKLKEGSAAEALTALLEFAGRSGSDKLVQSAENYISLCCYLLLRNIYLANPHNSERIFSLGGDDLARLERLLADEPRKIAAYARTAKDVKRAALEPDEYATAQFLQLIKSCESRFGGLEN